ARLREVVELVGMDVHAAGSDLVEERLPQVRAAAIDERHVGAAAPAEPVAEAGRKLEPAGAATDYDDPFQDFSCSVFRRAAKSLPFAATTRPVSRNLSSPAKSPTRPPASRMRRTPAAMSQGERPISQKPSMRPQAT